LACDFSNVGCVKEILMRARRSLTAQLEAQRRSAPLRLLAAGLAALEAALALSSGYLLVLLLAASRRPLAAAQPVASAQPRLQRRLVALVPAHEEQGAIETAVASLLRCAYPQDRRRVIVIADNCDDLTAQRAHAAGAEVWERDDRELRGKGFALAWAIERLKSDGADFDAIVIVDADCTASRNLLSAIDLRLRGGANALQVNYLAGNPDASSASALRYAGFALMNTVRFLGKQRLGLSCGLVGTGMAFSRELLDRQQWRDVGLVEDGEYHMRLVLAGERSEFAHEASVSSPMPTALGGSGEERWEQGRLELIRRWTPRLVLSGIAKRDPVRLHTGLECLVPPQSLIAAAGLGSLAARLLLGPRRHALRSLTSLAGQAVFVLGGLRLVRAPSVVYRALAIAPALIVSKSLLYVRLLRGRGPQTWVRTERDGEI
jgi:cellulose synthase/poly-beta-1,6-N-acetylglucosamine synthase-like glycosyltransferase